MPEAASVERAPGLEPRTDRLIEPSPHGRESAAGGAARCRAAVAAAPLNAAAGFRLVVVHRDGTDGITYNLLGDQIDIGRTEGDLLFEDPHLAPRHARIVASLTGRVLTPLEARNGVYVRLRGAVDLQDGDHLLIGKQVLRFELVSEPERNSGPPSSTASSSSGPRFGRPGRGCGSSRQPGWAGTSST